MTTKLVGDVMLSPLVDDSPLKETAPSTKEMPWAWLDAQDHCYIPTNDCDVLVNSTHDYYRRVGQSELLDDLEHSYAVQLPKMTEYDDLLEQEPSCSFMDGLFIETIVCQWEHCEYEVETAEELQAHVGIHLARGIRRCLWRTCSKKNHEYSARYQLARHVSSHFDWKPHSCSQCGRSFSTAERCRLHQRAVHEAEVKYKCEICNEFFKTTSDRSHHMSRKHTKLRLSCPGCKKTYAGRTVLTKHQTTCKGAKNQTGTSE